MNLLDAAAAFADNFVRNLVLVGLGVGAIVAGGRYLTREPSGLELLERANPEWTIVSASGKPVRADDASGRGEVLLSHDDLGPSRIRRVDCGEVRKLFPSWFALPDVALGNCVRLDAAGETNWILNVRTPMPVTEIWDRHFEPVLDRLRLGYSGGRSGRFPEGAETDLPAGQKPPEERGSGGYFIDPLPGSGERPVVISFYRYAGTTELVFTFRPPPSPPPPP